MTERPHTMHYCKTGLATTALLAACAVNAAAGAPAQPVLLPTNLPGTMAVQGPPTGFDPLTANAQALAAYGFPVRPDALRAPEAYRAWHTAMRHALHRIAPVLALRPIRHTPLGYSSNWSGAALTNLATHWQPGSFKTIWGIFDVPTLSMPQSACSGWRYSSEWAGMDGSDTTDVVQAGIDADSYCAPFQFTTSYRPWYEWYPALGSYITNFSVAPRDQMLVIITAFNTTQAGVYVENETTGDYVNIEVTAPAGTLYSGKSAEWITERPEVNNAVSTLASYGSDTYAAYAFDTAGTLSVPGKPAWLVYSTLITMLDSNGYAISNASLSAPSSVNTVVTGSAK